jgi:hypothetical protein
MTCDEKALIFLAFLGLAILVCIHPKWRMKNPANALTWRAFYLVAGVGFGHLHRLPPLVVTIRG